MIKVQKLSDRFLIENCEALSKKPFPTFIDSKTEISLRKLLGEFGPDDNIKADSFDKYHFLWKDMLSDAISFLKYNDRREFNNTNHVVREKDKIAFGVNELYAYYKEYRDFEALLYGADEFYRDHIAHVFRVWFIGNWIIEKFDNSISWDYDKIVKDDTSLLISKDEIYAIWCIIALAHDLGYPLDKVNKIKHKINSMMAYFGGITYGLSDFQIPSHHHFINDFILKFIASKLVKIENGSGKIQYKTSVQSKYYLKFSKSFEKYNHGIITCILLMKNLIYFLESDMDLERTFSETEDARQFYIRREILRAIAGHTSTDIYHLYPNAISFILILADELQVWERPTFHEMKNERQIFDICRWSR